MATALERRPRGRPPIPYQPDIAEQICEALATSSKGLSAVLAEMPNAPGYSVVIKWLANNDDFATAYAHARKLQADALVDEIIEIADEAEGDAELAYRQDGTAYAKMNGRNVRRAEVMIAARKWTASKLHPSRYGDKLDVTSAGEALQAAPLNPMVADQRLLSLMQLAAQRAAAEREAQDLLG